MCLVVIAWKVHPRWRLLLAGNRDEFHARPTSPLARWAPTTTAAALYAGRDLVSGGTWAGLDARGRCAVVTNVRDPKAPMVTGSSRGDLPVDFVTGDRSAAQYASKLQVRTPAYSPFNLLTADATRCLYVGNHPSHAHMELPPGIHGMSNGGFDLPWPKTQRLAHAVQAWVESDGDDPAPLWAAVSNEDIAPDAELPDTGVGLALERRLSPAFIRGPDYGTRASTLIALDHAGQGWISERRFGPDGVFEGETTLHNHD